MTTKAVLAQQIGQSIKATRRAAGVSRSVVARRAQIAEERLRHLEIRGVEMSPMELHRVACAIGCSVIDFFEVPGNQPRTLSTPDPHIDASMPH